LKKDFFRLSILLLIVVAIFYIFQQQQIAKESITYFPIDPTVTFPKSSTSLEFSKKRFDEYSIKWKTNSSINKRAFLRQDMSFLYANGKLVSTMGEWKQNTMELSDEKSYVATNSSLFQSISFHYAELHDNSDRIFSSQKISGDSLYVVNSQFESDPLIFHTAKSKSEKEWKKTLDDETNDYIQASFMNTIETYNISLDEYPTKMILTDILQYNDYPIGMFTKDQSAKIIGQLTEGLYKNYFLGITKADGTTIDPIGSSIPVILLSNDHLLVLFTTKDKEPIVLRQQISNI